MNLSSKPANIPVLFLIMVCILSACGRQEFPNKPFVYENKVIVKKTNLTHEERKKLQEELPNYWDDSLSTRKLQQLVFFYRLRNPPVFDTVNIGRSVSLMKGYLKSQGYYYPSLDDTFYVKKHNNQQRVYITMTVDPGKATILDSLAYNFADTSLQQLAVSGAKQSLIKPGSTHFTKQVIGGELDRIVDTFKVRGYLKMSRDNVVAEADTMDISLLQITTDPFLQAEMTANALKKQQENPKASLRIMERRNADSSLIDSSALRKYYIGDIYYYPETSSFDIFDSLIDHHESLRLQRYSSNFNNYYMLDKDGKFVIKPLREHTYLRRGMPYNENLYFKTINNLSQIGSWRQVDARPVLRADTVDMHLFLVPYSKQNVTFDLETSRNTGDFLSSGNLFGLAFNVTYRDRNVWKRAIQAFTNARTGIEFTLEKDRSFLQTFYTSFGHNYSIPRFITPWKIKKAGRLDGVKTIVGLNAAYSERSQYFRLRSFVTAFGYEWISRKKILWQYKPINLEFYGLDSLKLLQQAIQTNPFLKTAFNTGNVISQTLSATTTFPGRNKNNTNYLRFAVEEAGAIFGRIPALQKNIFQYIKVEGEYRKNIPLRNNTSLAFRAFGGVGYNYGNSDLGQTLPFYKQFIGGGPNSMRAWTLRQLGLGSSLASDTSNSYRDRYGDMQLEANMEYRFQLMTIAGVKVASALFADVGNIWNIKKDSALPKAEFDISRLGKDIAIGLGTGLRFDFTYFLIRLDFGIKWKDPARLENNGWMSLSDFTWRNKEFLIKDANGRVINRNNYAFQLGINLPF